MSVEPSPGGVFLEPCGGGLGVRKVAGGGLALGPRKSDVVLPAKRTGYDRVSCAISGPGPKSSSRLYGASHEWKSAAVVMTAAGQSWPSCSNPFLRFVIKKLFTPKSS